MAQDVIINGVTYSDVPTVEIPKDGGGTASFDDTSDATLDSGGKMLSGVTAYAGGTKYTGSIASKSSSDLTASGATVTAPATPIDDRKADCMTIDTTECVESDEEAQG